MHPRIGFLILSTAIAATGAGGQAPTLPAIRRLGAPVAVSGKIFRSVSIVRVLPSGGVLVNDAGGRRLVLVDSAFGNLTVVADSSAAAVTQYGARAAGLIPYLGDSTLLVETVSPSMYMIDPNGKVVRTMAVPSPRDAFQMTPTTLGGAASTDALGRLVYKGAAPRLPPAPKLKQGEVAPVEFPDSVPIQRADLVTRKVETIAWYKRPKLIGVRLGQADGSAPMIITNAPLRYTDDFAVLSDGTIAILRGGDYHLDLLSADGSAKSTPRIPYSWERLTDDAKVAFMDSVRKADDDANASRGGTQMVSGGTSGSGGATAAGGGLSAGGPPPGFAAAAAEHSYVKPSALPDYRPAFDQGALRADALGRLWIRTLQPARTPGVVIYDIVTSDGKLVDRVELPSDRTIVGFDKHDHVYLAPRDVPLAWVERVRVRP